MATGTKKPANDELAKNGAENQEEKLSDKEKALRTAIATLEKNYGKGTVMKLGEKTTMKVDHISTGSLSLDYALGIGGLPRGRIVEIYGAESSGKTTIALHVAAEAQKNGGEVAFIDVEHALDPVYAANIGVDIDSLLVSQPDTGEQALEITEALVRSGAIDAVIIDSVAALVPKAEIEGEMGDAHVGLQARLMSQALRKLTGAISKSNCIAIFINQLREKMGNAYYGPSETTTGGRALKFYSTVRLEVKRIEQIKVTGSEVVGCRTKVKVVKNKIAPPFKEAIFDIMFGKGISREGEIIDLGEQAGVIRHSGAWFYCGDQKIGQGRENAKLYLAQNKDARDEIESKIRAALYGNGNSSANNAPDGTDKPADSGDAPEGDAPAKKVNIDIMFDD